MQSAKSSQVAQEIEDKNKPITELSYNGKSYKLRRFGFKTFTSPAIKLYEAYQKYCEDFGADIQAEIKKEIFKRPELLPMINITQVAGDVTNLSPKQLMSLHKILLKEEDFFMRALDYQAKNERAKEIFLTTGLYSKQICDCLFEKCDIDHSDEALDKLNIEEFNKYMTFMKGCLDFFLHLL